MSAATPTPGPWTYWHAGSIEAEFTIGTPEFTCVAHVWADEERGVTGGTVEANARLLAAAPDLLAVAKAYLDALQPYADAIPEEGEGGDHGWWEHYRSVVDAIAKAEGRTP